MSEDIRGQDNYKKMLKYFKDIQMEYFNIYESYGDNDYTKYVHLVAGNKMCPIKFHIEITREEEALVFSIWVSVKTNEFMFEGDRSDCTDVISTIMAISISMIDNIEISLLDMSHPVGIEGEIYGRILAFMDSKIIKSNFQDKGFTEQLDRIISVTVTANMILCALVNLEPYCNDIVKLSYEEFNLGINSILGEDANNLACNYIKRKNEDWEWWYNEKLGISSINFKNEIGEKLLDLMLGEEILFIEGVNRDIISYRDRTYTIDKEKFEYAKRILNHYQEDKYNIIAISNKFFVISPHNIIPIFDKCGFDSVIEEKELIRERRKLEDKILFGESIFEWNRKIDGGRFEDLIREILSKEMYISRVRKAGPTNQPDNGLDLIIEYIDFNNKKYSDNESPFEIKKIIGQCKAYKDTVGKSDVRDIRDTLDYYNADGYWLFVSSQISIHLSEYLQKLRDNNDLLIDWWNRAEIEEVLKNYPEIINKYKDIFIVEQGDK